MVSDPPDPEKFVESQFSGSHSGMDSADFTPLDEESSKSESITQKLSRDSDSKPEDDSSGRTILVRILLFYGLSVAVISVILSTTLTLPEVLIIGVLGGILPVGVLYFSPLSCVPRLSTV